MKLSRMLTNAFVIASIYSGVGYAADMSVAEQIDDELVVTTWNVEHLAYPANSGCKPRSEAEIGKLKAYAASLDADIVAMQEVASIKAVEQLFPKSQWQLYISEREDSPAYTCRKTGALSTQQKVAFAVRNGIKVNQVNSVDELGLGMEGLRHGLALAVDTTLGHVNLLNVHMKSGCFVDNYAREDSEACQIFAKQAPILDNWIETQEKLNTPYIVLGDFNHRLSAPYNRLTMELTSNTNGSASSIVNTSADMIGCHPYYPAPIDHIWVGGFNGKISKPAQPVPFKDMNPKAMLSDHCAVSVSLTNSTFPLSNSVKWHVSSKEYAYLTTSIYQRAAETIARQAPANLPWAVVMDIDETVLNNVGYQVSIEQTGQSYHPTSWASWVKSEKATLVPGVKAFIKAVIDQGGKLALITNRDRTLDQYTWRNLQALGLPISLDNTCLMGRVEQDITAMSKESIVNDKDLRRQQIEAGTASCFQSTNSRHSRFVAHKIVMQVGDNIEDFALVSQENADVDALINAGNGSLVLLPNAMYGSW